MTCRSLCVSVVLALSASGLSAVPAFADAGQDLYAANCALCHGDDGRANTDVGRAMQAKSLIDPKLVSIDADAFLALWHANPKHAAVATTVSDADLRTILPYVKKLAAGG